MHIEFYRVSPSVILRVLLLVTISVFLVGNVQAQNFCYGSGYQGNCQSCSGVGICDCLVYYGETSCASGSGQLCLVDNYEIWDGGDGNCQYIACDLWNWACGDM